MIIKCIFASTTSTGYKHKVYGYKKYTNNNRCVIIMYARHARAAVTYTHARTMVIITTTLRILFWYLHGFRRKGYTCSLVVFFVFVFYLFVLLICVSIISNKLLQKSNFQNSVRKKKNCTPGPKIKLY